MTETPGSPRSPTFFYGWVLVAVLLLMLSVGMGTSMYMYSVVAGAVGEAFEASRFVLMMGSTGMLLLMGLCSPLLGRLLDRYPSKWILIVGALAMGLGFILIALSTRVWMVVASYVLFIGVGAATLSTLTMSTLLSRWFRRHRGLAIGIAALGTQAGGFVYPPLVAGLMETYDWRFALAALGLTIMVVLPPIIWLLVVDRPEDRNLHPDGVAAPDVQGGDSSPAPVVPKLALPELLRHHNFLLLVLIAGVGVMTNTVLLANLSLFATDLGEEPVRGAFLVSLVALLGVFFSPFIGWLCDVVNIKIATVVVTLSLAAACAVFSLANTYALLLIATCFMGIGGGGIFPLWASLVGRLYHTRVYGQVMGFTTLAIALITAAAPPFGGWIHDTTESYRLLFLTLLALLCAVTLLTVLIRIPRNDEEKYGAETKMVTAG